MKTFSPHARHTLHRDLTLVSNVRCPSFTAPAMAIAAGHLLADASSICDPIFVFPLVNVCLRPVTSPAVKAKWLWKGKMLR
jgi:hypothetical protein